MKNTIQIDPDFLKKIEQDLFKPKQDNGVAVLPVAAKPAPVPPKVPPVAGSINPPVEFLTTNYDRFLPCFLAESGTIPPLNSDVVLLFDFDHWLTIARLSDEKIPVANLGVNAYRYFAAFAKKYQSAIPPEELRQCLADLMLWVWYCILFLYVERPDSEYNLFAGLIEAAANEFDLEYYFVCIQLFAGWEADDRSQYLSGLKRLYMARKAKMKGVA